VTAEPAAIPSASARAARVRDLLLITLVCALFFAWRIGHLPLIDPDEPFYSLSSREMLEAGDWMVPRIFGQPQFEKPPLVYWTMIASYRRFGVTEGAARVPMAAAAMALVFATYLFGERRFGRRAGLAAALVLATGVEFMVTSRLVLTDTLFALFTALACFAFWDGAQDPARRRPRWIAAFAWAGVAALTKGPLGLLVPTLAALASWRRAGGLRRGDAATLAIGALVFAAIAVPWYAAMVHRFGTDYAREFFGHENWERLVRAEHRENDTPWYYPAVLAVGSLPWLPALVAACASLRAAWRRDPTAAYLWGWLIANLAFFTIARSKLPTYVLFAFVPLALLAGRAITASDATAPAPRWGARIAALVQVDAFTVAALAPIGVALPPPVRAGLGAVAALLAIGSVALWRGRVSAWLGATVLAASALLVTLLAFGGTWLDDLTSVRTAARAIATARKPGEALIVERFLVRGVTYYARQTPVVLSRGPRPYWTQHPLPVVVGADGLREFVREHGGALCLVETRGWPVFATGVPTGWTATKLLDGQKTLVRIAPPAGDAVNREH